MSLNKINRKPLYYGVVAFLSVSAQAQINPESILLQSKQPKLLPDELAVTVPDTPNPLTSLRPENSFVDYNQWNMRNYLNAISLAAKNPEAKIKITGNGGKGTITLSKFGTGKSQANSAQISGTFELPPTTLIYAGDEDNGSITLASETGLADGQAVEVSSVIGDGPFGFSGTQSGDFDFYAVRNVAQGGLISVEVNTEYPYAPLDPAVAIYDAEGNIIAFNDDSRGTFDSFTSVTAPASGDYFIGIGTYGNPILLDPFDSSSGGGVESTFFTVPNEGTYQAIIKLNYYDEQLVTFTPKKGDVVGAALNGIDGQLFLIDKSGDVRQGATNSAASSFYTGSPLPAGAVSVAHVVDRPGLFTLKVRGTSSGDYTLDVGSYLPSLAAGDTGEVQTIFIDFDGQTVDLSESLYLGYPFPIMRELSPLSAFLPYWGLTADDENAVIDAILMRLEESLVSDLDMMGPNPKFNIRILNSRDHEDPFGQPNVSRVIVGGSISELGISTIGIAQSIDVGNYNTEETAFVLLDLLSGMLSSSVNLNNYPLAPGESIIDIIAVGVGEIVAHEAGHYLGSWHTDQFNAVPNIMDQGGNLEFTILGLGEDGVFGTSDDVNVEFVRDIFNPNEFFTGFENTQSAIAFGSTEPKK